MMNDEERREILEEEGYILRDSGEIPEIAYHSTLYYLSRDPDGPRLLLTEKELEPLQEAALYRYREIVLRDITHENRDVAIFRGLRRTIYNWQRMEDFCKRINGDCGDFQAVVVRTLLDFLERELRDVISGSRKSSVNCTAEQLLEFASLLEVSVEALPAGWEQLCKQAMHGKE